MFITSMQFNNCRKVINEALLLQRLNELSTMSIPLRSPDSWAPGEWSKSLEADVSPYLGAIYSQSFN